MKVSAAEAVRCYSEGALAISCCSEEGDPCLSLVLAPAVLMVSCCCSLRSYSGAVLLIIQRPEPALCKASQAEMSAQEKG